MAQTPDEPLTMTVHSLPHLDQGSARSAEATRSGRWKMLLLMLVCASPVIASYVTYYVIRPQARTNYGELIQPQRPIPAMVAVNAQGQTVPLASLKDQWLLVSVGDSACDERCQQHLYLQHQLRETLGRDKDRLDWVWLRTGAASLTPSLAEATKSATVLLAERNEIANWLQPAAGAQLEDHLYVVDPLGNWMMRFPAELEPKQVQRDLNRLLRASAFWDTAGRVTN